MIEVLKEIKELKSLVENKVHKYLTLEECSKQSSLSISSLRRAIWSGSLKAKKPSGGKYVIRMDWLENWLNGK